MAFGGLIVYHHAISNGLDPRQKSRLLEMGGIVPWIRKEALILAKLGEDPRPVVALLAWDSLDPVLRLSSARDSAESWSSFWFLSSLGRTK